MTTAPISHPARSDYVCGAQSPGLFLFIHGSPYVPDVGEDEWNQQGYPAHHGEGELR